MSRWHSIILFGVLSGLSAVSKPSPFEFDTKQPVLQPIIPRQPGLIVDLPGCGDWTARICRTQCLIPIPPNADLRARLAWTDAFDADDNWDHVEDKPVATPEALPMALNISQAFRAKAQQSHAIWEGTRNECHSMILAYAPIFDMSRFLSRPIGLFLLQTFGFIQPQYDQMVLDAVALWYADDMVRRVQHGITTGCSTIHYGDAEEDDLCAAPAPDLNVTLSA